MMKTWLIRRAVRRPVDEDVTARINSSVCRLPFISSSPLACVNELDGLGRRGVAVRHVDDLEAADVEAELLARSLRSCAPVRPGSGTMIRAAAASTRAAQRGLIARMHHDGGRGRNVLRARNQAVVFAFGRVRHRGRAQPPD